MILDSNQPTADIPNLTGLGKVLSKRGEFGFIRSYIVDLLKPIRSCTWLNRRILKELSVAVVMFALRSAALVGVVRKATHLQTSIEGKH